MGLLGRVVKGSAVLAVLAPCVAAACPACATRGGLTGAVGWAIAAMIASPLLVGGVVAGVAWRLHGKP